MKTSGKARKMVLPSERAQSTRDPQRPQGGEVQENLSNPRPSTMRHNGHARAAPGDGGPGLPVARPQVSSLLCCKANACLLYPIVDFWAKFPEGGPRQRGDVQAAGSSSRRPNDYSASWPCHPFHQPPSTGQRHTPLNSEPSTPSSHGAAGGGCHWLAEVAALPIIKVPAEQPPTPSPA
jgi:hypothetical protein